MSTNNRSNPQSQADRRAASIVQRVPLSVRMAVYGTFFLVTVLAVIPWIFYRIDLYVPAVHVELGVLRLLGWALFSVGLVMYVVSSYVLTHRGKGAFVEFDPPTELVVTGPFRYTRNPVAAFLLAAMLGLAVGLSSTGVLIMFLVFAALIQFQVTRVEEPLLRERYREAYEEYCANVPRWVPRSSPWTPPERPSEER